jgi:DNA-binding PadR family transcriptional regulator
MMTSPGRRRISRLFFQAQKHDIRSEWRTGKNGRQRKYYGLTAKGKKVAQESQRKWAFFTNAVNAILSSA